MQASASKSKRVIVGITGTIARPCYRVRWKANVASLPAEPPQKKRISKNERRVLIEAFVEKYRASNGGRFPSGSVVRENIGGSYYIARAILQEMQYNLKNSPSEKFNTHQEQLDIANSDVKGGPCYSSKEKSENSASGENKTPSVIESKVENSTINDAGKGTFSYSERIEENVSEGVKKTCVKEYLDPAAAEIDSPCNSALEIGEHSGTSVANSDVLVQPKEQNAKDANNEGQDNDEHSGLIQTTNSTSSDNAEKMEASLSKAAPDFSHTPIETEGSRSDFSSAENLLKESNIVVTEQRETHEVHKLDELDSQHPSQPEQDRSSSAATKLWGNLKSFASGIVGFWKKL